jgi:hypothetical protein
VRVTKEVASARFVERLPNCLLIGGQFVEASPDGTFESINLRK